MIQKPVCVDDFGMEIYRCHALSPAARAAQASAVRRSMSFGLPVVRESPDNISA